MSGPPNDLNTRRNKLIDVLWSGRQPEDGEASSNNLSTGLNVASAFGIKSVSTNSKELRQGLQDVYDACFKGSHTQSALYLRNPPTTYDFHAHAVATTKALLKSEHTSGCWIADSWAKYAQCACLIMDTKESQPLFAPEQMPVLIVTHASLIGRWKEKLNDCLGEAYALKFLQLKTSGFGVTVAEMQTYDVVLASYDDLARQFSQMKMLDQIHKGEIKKPSGHTIQCEDLCLVSEAWDFDKKEFRFVLLDEPTEATNPDSKLFKAVQSINRDKMIILHSRTAELDWDVLYAISRLIIPGLLADDGIASLEQWKREYGEFTKVKNGEAKTSKPPQGDDQLRLQRMLAICTIWRPACVLTDAFEKPAWPDVCWKGFDLRPEELVKQKEKLDGTYMTQRTLVSAISASNRTSPAPSDDEAVHYFKVTNVLAGETVEPQELSRAPDHIVRARYNWVSDGQPSSRTEEILRLLVDIKRETPEARIAILSQDLYMVRGLAVAIQASGMPAAVVHSDLSLEVINQRLSVFRKGTGFDCVCIEAQIAFLDCDCFWPSTLIITETWFDDLRSSQAVRWCLNELRPKNLQVFQLYARNSYAERIVYAARTRFQDVRRLCEPLIRKPNEHPKLTATISSEVYGHITHSSYTMEDRSRGLSRCFPQFVLDMDDRDEQEIARKAAVAVSKGVAVRRKGGGGRKKKQVLK